MKLKLFALHDQALEAYGSPMSYTTRGQALREFTDQVNDKSSQINKHPEHYTLHYLGEYDNANASFNTEGAPLQVSAATDVIRE